MNYSVIRRTVGWLLLFETGFFLVPLITSVIYWEKEFFDFLLTMAITGALGYLFVYKKPKSSVIYAKEGFVIVALSWIVMSLFGALPFWFSKTIPSYVDALFETVSGFTTTGSSILSGEQIDALFESSKSILMWRSFTHWVGGMGVLVLIMAFLPLSGAKNMNLMRAESTGASVGKLVPKVRQTAFLLYTIYSVMTVVQFIALLVSGMPIFDSLATAFGTAGTGGFGIKSDSFASYTAAQQIIVTVFMLLFSVNFNSYYLLLRRKLKDAFNIEVRAFFAIVLAAIALITVNLLMQPEVYGYETGEAIRHSAFSGASVISTTGFATEDFALWPMFSQSILVLLMFIGACAGSTGGGMKVSRVLVLGKGCSHEVGRLIHPNQVKKISIDGKVVEHEVVRSINAYIVALLLVFVSSILLISLEGYDFTTTFTSVVATLNNIGPGLGMVGPSGNFAFFGDFSKLVFIFDMLAGRLELFPMLVLFAPSTWRK